MTDVNKSTTHYIDAWTTAGLKGTRHGFMDSWEKLVTVFPELIVNEYRCPRCGNKDMLPGLIPHLVDIHDMPREDIANWLDTL